jgi:predicted nucleic-acid-binding Zn-ribbon protein
MREGAALGQATAFGGTPYLPTAGFAMGGMAGFGVAEGGSVGEQRIMWREKTGSKTGWIMKSDEEKTMKISGRRCTKCGFIEFYAHEQG